MSGAVSLQSVTVDDISHLVNKPVQLSVLRLDKIHPLISGNKWFKLRYYLEDAKAQGKTKITTFGGAWSNHILATAAACRANGLESVGIIRGEEPATYSSTLRDAMLQGMKLVFLPRSDYDGKSVPPDLFSPETYLVPEGGYGETGMRGAATILDCCGQDFTHYCCAAGTGTMTAGLINASRKGQEVIAISVLKNNTGLATMIRALLKESEETTHWQVLNDYHFGGYAKHTPVLFRFMNDFYQQSGIPSDFVYTGKLFYAIMDQVQKDFFPAGSRILLVHSGGLQGNASLVKGTLRWE